MFGRIYACLLIHAKADLSKWQIVIVACCGWAIWRVVKGGECKWHGAGVGVWHFEISEKDRVSLCLPVLKSQAGKEINGESGVYQSWFEKCRAIDNWNIYANSLWLCKICVYVIFVFGLFARTNQRKKAIF